jgi:signal transduction histidine kinase
VLLRRRVEDALRMRDEFVSLASHELRTPITALKLRVQVMRRALQSGPEAAREQLPAMLDGLDHRLDQLMQLCNDLIWASDIESGKLLRERMTFDLVGLVRAVVSRVREQRNLPKEAIELRAEEPVVGRWSRTQLDELVMVLVKNAVTFGAGKPVEVELHAKGDRARLVVRDHGTGISAKDRATIFERFGRAASMMNFGGLGLGLYIARAIVRAHGGTIEVEGSGENGTAFIVEVPRDIGEERDGGGQGEGSQDGPSRRSA